MIRAESVVRQSGVASMAAKLTDVLKNHQPTQGPAPDVHDYQSGFTEARRGNLETRRNKAGKLANLYYDLVTVFYEFGWGRSFHLAPRAAGESFQASLARHEHFLAHALGLRQGMLVADIGCGVGGPLIEIARFTGAKIVGVDANAYQIERARTLTAEPGLEHLAEFLLCDFRDIDAPDNSFDAVYDIEATCHAPDKVGVYAEVFRVLKPAGRFGAYEYCMTHRFDPESAEHLRIKADIEEGGSLRAIDDYETVERALRTVGFEVLEIRDLTEQSGPPFPGTSRWSAPRCRSPDCAARESGGPFRPTSCAFSRGHASSRVDRSTLRGP